jgi:MFS family permease
VTLPEIKSPTTMQTALKTKLSIFMFLQYFIWSTWYMTLGAYLGTLNFSGTEIGASYGAFAWGAILSPFIVGLIADRFFASEKIIAVLGIAGGLVMFVIPQLKTFGSVYPTLILYCTLYAPTLALGNSVSMTHLADAKKDFPFVKIFSAVGWIAGGVVLSQLKAEQSSLQNYLAGAVARGGRGPYIYFACAWGPKFIRHELQLIKTVANIMTECAPAHRLVVRPYVMSADNSILSELRKIPNLDLDPDFLESLDGRPLDVAAIRRRLSIQDGADVFIHAGTTMGFEGAHLRSPMLLILPSMADGLPLVGNRRPSPALIGQQHHIIKYLAASGFPNVVGTSAALRQSLRECLSYPERYTAYSKRISAFVELRSMGVVVSNLLHALDAGAPEQPRHG